MQFRKTWKDYQKPRKPLKNPPKNNFFYQKRTNFELMWLPNNRTWGNELRIEYSTKLNQYHFRYAMSSSQRCDNARLFSHTFLFPLLFFHHPFPPRSCWHFDLQRICMLLFGVIFCSKEACLNGNQLCYTSPWSREGKKSKSLPLLFFVALGRRFKKPILLKYFAIRNFIFIIRVSV